MLSLFFCFVFVLLASMISETQGHCRNLRFTSAPIHGHRLTNHVMRTIDVINEDLCSTQCYLEPICVSYNFNTKQEDNGQHKCDLNNDTFKHDNKHSDDLVRSQNYVYRGAENACANKPCKNNATCQAGFTNKNYQCLCIPGFTGHDCEVDVDECANEIHICNVNAVCNNTQGSYKCTCKDGFVGDGVNCNDIDECGNGTHSCDVNAVCNNTQGSYNCTCKDGFVRDGENCTENPRSVIICEGHTSTISCENGKTIKVLDANYGRLDDQTCIHVSIKDTNCRSNKSLEVVRENCNGKTSCSLSASNSVFGSDPCLNTYKYLEVKYRCIENVDK